MLSEARREADRDKTGSTRASSIDSTAVNVAQKLTEDETVKALSSPDSARVIVDCPVTGIA